jgi:lysine 2,3-aminomutase
LQLKLDEADETKAIGIEKLLTDANDEISLVPNGNSRLERRNNNE